MARYELQWIDKDAQEGPLFRIGTRDVYSRDRRGSRVVRLAARHSPDVDYIEPAVIAFRELAERWQAPVVFIIDPDVKRPPASRFLYEWSRRTFAENSVDQSYMIMNNPLTQALGRVVCRMFVAGGMPIEAISEREVQRRLDALDLSVGRDDFHLNLAGTALVAHGAGADGAYGQLLRRLVRRVAGRSS